MVGEVGAKHVGGLYRVEVKSESSLASSTSKSSRERKSVGR